LTVFSQTDTSKVTESVKCLPVSTFKKIAEDLLRGDSVKFELELSNKEILKLEEKIILKDSITTILNKKEDNYKLTINTLDSKIYFLEKFNDELSTDLKKQKVKNKFKGFLNNFIIITLITLLIIK
jgi:uncharacterized protein YdcH (DUF465 family)